MVDPSAAPAAAPAAADRLTVLHLTTVDVSLDLLLGPVISDAVARHWNVVTASAPGPHVAAVESRGARHIALMSSTRRFDLLADLRTAWDLWRLLRRERPDVLHTHTPKPGLYGRVIGRLAGVPAVINTVHGLYAQETDPWWKRLAVYTAEFIGGHASHAELVHNPEDLEVMRRFHLAPRSHLHLLGSGVDVARYSTPNPVSRERIRGEWGIGDDVVLIGSVGRLVAEKGFRELFGAVEGLEGARLVVVGGEDPDKPDALDPDEVDRARRSGVIFAGFRSDMADVYGALDVFVLASHREGFPRVAMEAAASRLPIVATDIRGCRQVVEHGVTGLLVPLGSVAALRSAILRIVSDASLRRAMGEAAQRRACDEFDERAVLRRIASCYAETLGKRRPRVARVPRD